MSKEPSENKMVKRSPIVCIMGHIDHGKSTLLDYIRKTNIVDTEAGGITQRISAYEVIHKMSSGKEEKITFLDTPGHESFGAMRICGTTIADIAVLIVSAEEGVKKQTMEALKCIIDGNIPYVVAINKIDRPDANVEKTKNSLVENGIYIEGFGGSIPYVPISAKTGQGIEELMDMIILVAEMSELKKDLSKRAEGIILEANLDKQKGITATIVIKDGKLENGMFVVCGDKIAPTRIMENFLGKKITEAEASSPVRIIGFDKLPKVGSPFQSFYDKKEAEKFISEEKEKNKKVIIKKYDMEESPDEIYIRIMIKAEVAGSIDAIEHELNKIKSDKVKIKIVGAGIGDISENDVKLASGRNPAIIIGFDVGIDSTSKDLAERSNVEIKIFDIIYKVSEWLQEEVEKKTPKVMVEETTAKVKVLKVFSSMKDKHVIGGRVENGMVSVGQEAKIMRKEVEIGKGKIKELQKDKEKVGEVREGVEFGCQFQSEITPAPGDKLEIFITVEK
ncbi:MAG: translation initiation factor IF-2 [Candidatus Taylorbacteria bacterium]|nr:translation initiation factor IF-2 [Candidatus Taylorbacteria bacterium]